MASPITHRRNHTEDEISGSSVTAIIAITRVYSTYLTLKEKFITDTVYCEP
jgi:hypothetical protein